MKKLLLSVLAFIVLTYSHAQEGYPEPTKTEHRLFYIQHSNNFNTYVYDAHVKEGQIDPSQPIEQYRIVYTEGGVKKPLTNIQRRMAYGMILVETSPNRFKFRLTATTNLYFHLTLLEDKGPQVYVTVNRQKIYLDRMFVQLKKGYIGTSIDADYVLFYGRDYHTGKAVIEKFGLK